MILQLSEGLGQFRKRRTVAKRPGLALNDGQIVPPVVDRARRLVMGPLDQPFMFAQDLPFGGDNNPFGIDPQADRAVREGCRNAVTIAVEMDQAGRRHAFALLDQAVEGRRQRHQGRRFLGPHSGDGAGLSPMRDISPQFEASLFQPGIQCRKIGKARRRLPKPVSRILNILLDLPLLPTRRRIAELRLEDIMVRHGEKPQVDPPFLAATDAIHRRPHIVVDASLRDATQDAKPMPVEVKQHLVGLQHISPNQEGPAVRQLDMGDLKLRAIAGQNGKVLAPVELESFARAK